MALTGPAGTGKTESVKALGNQLGRFVLVFNCDERFDFQVHNHEYGTINMTLYLQCACMYLHFYLYVVLSCFV